MRTEEAKLKAKYPNLGQKPGGSDFLMKRLQKGVSLKMSTCFFQLKKYMFLKAYSFYIVFWGACNIAKQTRPLCHSIKFQCKIWFKSSIFFCLQQKYFDSGDYNMAKAKMKNKQLPAAAGPDKNIVTGDHIPTPQDLPQRKSSLVTSKLAG